MATTVRLIAALAAILLTHGVAFAQLPTAPQPHLSLDEVVKEYKWWQLPIPSPDSQLVLLKSSYPPDKPHWLAFRHPPAKPGGETRYLVSSRWYSYSNTEWTPLPTPTPADLEGLDGWPTDWVCLAAQFKLRGWNDLAMAAYSKARAEFCKPVPMREEKFPAPLGWIYSIAWGLWEEKLTDRQSDRKEIFARLTYLAGVGYEGAPWRTQPLLTDLKLTLAPRKSKSGSVEALIDDLTDLWDDPEDLENEIGQTAYWKLVELGWDAVPALIEHLKDRRLTRTKLNDWKTGQYVDVMRVNQPVEYILNKFSGGRFETEHYWVTADRVIEPKDHRWLEMVRCGGEEAWLLDNVIPEDAEEHEQIPNAIILRVIRAKYPQRLKDVYQTVVLKRPIVRSDPITKAILASKLPLKDKVAILELGATSKVYKHSVAALEAIAEIDAPTFRKHLLKTLEEVPPELKLSRNDTDSDLLIIGAIRRTDDQKSWDTLAALSRHVTPTTRMFFIHHIGWPCHEGEPELARRQCIRYLLSFLNDTATENEPGDECPAVRDYATIRLAFLLEFFDFRELPSWRSPREISLLRARVREVAERELARPIK